MTLAERSNLTRIGPNGEIYPLYRQTAATSYPSRVNKHGRIVPLQSSEVRGSKEMCWDDNDMPPDLRFKSTDNLRRVSSTPTLSRIERRAGERSAQLRGYIEYATRQVEAAIHCRAWLTETLKSSGDQSELYALQTSIDCISIQINRECDRIYDTERELEGILGYSGSTATYT